MNSPIAQAILLVLVAAAMTAAYALPMKLNKKWQWEHTWFAFSLLGVNCFAATGEPAPCFRTMI